MAHFVQTITDVLSKIERDLEISSHLSDAINSVEEEIQLKDISLGNIVRRWRQEPRMQDEGKFKLLRIEGDEAFQEKMFCKAMKKYR